MGGNYVVNVDSDYILSVSDLKSFHLFEPILPNCVGVGRNSHQDFHCGVRCY